MSFEQYADIVVSNPSGRLVTDYTGAVYSGTAKLYIAPPGTVDALSVDPVDVTVTDGEWSYEFNADTDGVWVFQIRAEGPTHGSSPEFRLRVNASPFAAPEVPVTP